MHPRTEATLRKIGRANWFCNVGVRDTNEADILSSWPEAIESCGSLEWENLCLEAANQYRERLVERSPERFEAWNDIVDMIKPAAIALVKVKTKRVIEEHNLPKVFLDTVNWDIVHLCMEAEFADVYPPVFYASQAYWYMEGHFPCGWIGQFPEGRHIIY
jgi:hypothetical protein